MVSVGMRNELQELIEFLRLGVVYLNGHPNEPDVIALREAVENVLANTAVETALAVIKSAVSDGSWFRIVLDEHQTKNDDVKFIRAMQLCERLAPAVDLRKDPIISMFRCIDLDDDMSSMRASFSFCLKSLVFVNSCCVTNLQTVFSPSMLLISWK